MPNPENVLGLGWKPGESGNPNGRPKGSLNRSTIAKRVLEMNCELPDEAYNKIKAIYPDIEKRMSAEEMATIVQITNAISKGDTAAYKSVMDSAYGAPKQDIDHTTKGESLNLSAQQIKKISDDLENEL